MTLLSEGSCASEVGEGRMEFHVEDSLIELIPVRGDLLDTGPTVVVPETVVPETASCLFRFLPLHEYL